MPSTFITILSRAADFALETLIPKDPDIRQVERFGTLLIWPQPVIGEHTECFYLSRYQNPFVQAALIEIKTRPNKKVATIIGKMLFEAVTRARRTSSVPPLVLPIPITAKKKRERGWNQCELILDGFLKATARAGQSSSFEARKDILIKSRENADQVGMSRTQRFENLKDCFSVTDSALVAGRSVIVFDDILTTGATFGDARRALAEAGAAKIICVAIAH